MNIRDIKIAIQRRIFRYKAARAKRNDTERMAKAIMLANSKSEKLNKRLWVLKLAYSDYAVVTKQQVRAFFTKMGLSRVNYMQTNEYIIHITKKQSE
jgi:hypothetical protein